MYKMQLVNAVVALIAVIDLVNCQGPTGATGAVENLPSGGRLSQVDRRFSSVDSRISPGDGRFSPTDRRISPIDITLSRTEGKLSPVDAGISPVDMNIPPVDMGMPPVDMGMPPVDIGMSQVDRRILPVDMGNPPVDRRILPVDIGSPTADRRGSLAGGRTSVGDGRISLFDGRNSPFDGRTSAVDGKILPVDGRISPVDRRVSPVDRRISPVDRRVSPADVGGPIVDRLIVPDLDDPMFVYDECVKAACTYPSLCYIPHPRNCFHFIMCKPLETGQIISQAMPCAFGTIWKPGFEPSCDRFDLVDCPTDKCKRPMVKAYAQNDNNCRTYWTCINRKSRPACCAKYHSFDPINNKCVSDIGCDSACPLLNDGTCGAPGVLLANFADGNCRTHWDCENGHPHPVCCPMGEGFDVYKSQCVPDGTCKHKCPKEYSESCAIPGTKSYDVLDKNCRTYIKCNQYGQSDPYCCLPGLMYSIKERRCINAVGKKCVNAICPNGYAEECRLEAIPGNLRAYKNLDAFGGMEMPCPVGTMYNASDCQCSTKIKNLEPAFCTMAIEAIFPDLKNLGTAVAALLMIGEYGQGETGVGNMINFWDGGAGINIPFYGSQSFNKMYLEARFRPTAGSHNKQVFTSSCNYVDGVPTVEVSLDQFQGTGGTIKVLAKSDGLPGLAEISFPYKFNDEIMFRVIYDGQKIGVFLDSNDPSMSNSAVRPLSGFINIHRSGLRFTHCRYEKNISGLIGYVSEIKFSKCLTRELQEALNAASPIV